MPAHQLPSVLRSAEARHILRAVQNEHDPRDNYFAPASARLAPYDQSPAGYRRQAAALQALEEYGYIYRSQVPGNDKYRITDEGMALRSRLGRAPRSGLTSYIERGSNLAHLNLSYGHRRNIRHLVFVVGGTLATAVAMMGMPVSALAAGWMAAGAASAAVTATNLARHLSAAMRFDRRETRRFAAVVEPNLARAREVIVDHSARTTLPSVEPTAERTPLPDPPSTGHLRGPRGTGDLGPAIG